MNGEVVTSFASYKVSKSVQSVDSQQSRSQKFLAPVTARQPKCTVLEQQAAQLSNHSCFRQLIRQDG